MKFYVFSLHCIFYLILCTNILANNDIFNNIEIKNAHLL